MALGRKNVIGADPDARSGAVTVDVNALEVIKHTTTVADHQQQTTTGVVIVLVLLEVLGQISDALGEQSNPTSGEPVSPSWVA